MGEEGCGEEGDGKRVMALCLHPTPPCTIPTTQLTLTSIPPWQVAPWFFFTQKSVMKPPSSLLAVSCLVLFCFTGLPDGAGIVDQEKRPCKRHLIHVAGCTEQSGEAGRKEAERRQGWRGACPGPGWVNCASGSRRFGSRGGK